MKLKSTPVMRCPSNYHHYQQQQQQEHQQQVQQPTQQHQKSDSSLPSSSVLNNKSSSSSLQQRANVNNIISNVLAHKSSLLKAANRLASSRKSNTKVKRMRRSHYEHGLEKTRLVTNNNSITTTDYKLPILTKVELINSCSLGKINTNKSLGSKTITASSVLAGIATPPSSSSSSSDSSESSCIESSNGSSGPSDRAGDSSSSSIMEGTTGSESSSNMPSQLTVVAKSDNDLCQQESGEKRSDSGKNHETLVTSRSVAVIDDVSQNNCTNNEQNNKQSSSAKSKKKSTVTLFNDYLLISSKTKYKYLLYSLFEQLKLENKNNYLIVDG